MGPSYKMIEKIEVDINHRIQVRRMRWRSALSIIRGREVSLNVRIKFCRTIVRCCMRLNVGRYKTNKRINSRTRLCWMDEHN